MAKFETNDRSPSYINEKQQNADRVVSTKTDTTRTPNRRCVCGTDTDLNDCCGSFLVSSERFKPSAYPNVFANDGVYTTEYKGRVYYSILSTAKEEWNAFHNIYIYGVEVNERYFRPKTVDNVVKNKSSEGSNWNISCNLDYQTGCLLEFHIPQGNTQNKMHTAECSIAVKGHINKIETPSIKVIDQRYLKLFHHTSREGYERITRSQTLLPSPYDMQGSKRELNKTHFAYFTDLPELKYEGDLFAVAMRENGRAMFRTDNNAQASYIDINDQPRSKREKHIVFYIDMNLIAPVPTIYHCQKGISYIEFFHPHIFRVGVDAESAIPIEPFRDGWKIGADFIQSKTTDIFPIANGNDLSDLFKIYQDEYIEP